MEDKIQSFHTDSEGKVHGVISDAEELKVTNIMNHLLLKLLAFVLVLACLLMKIMCSIAFDHENPAGPGIVSMVVQ